MRRERWREEEKTVFKRRCENPMSSDDFAEFSSVDESGSVVVFLCVFSLCFGWVKK